jgi:alkaline phosphatase
MMWRRSPEFCFSPSCFDFSEIFLGPTGDLFNLEMQFQMKSRRTFLKGLAAVPLIAAGCATSSQTHIRTAKHLHGKPKKIIHLVADGMSAGTLSCADHFSRLERGRGLAWFELAQRPGAQVGNMDMRSQDSLVTDSSAASSVWGSGVRIPNGKVNQASDGTCLITLYELLAEEGWKRGLVTTTEITHATPAGFATCTKSRDDAEIIAAQYLERRVDQLLGGGRKFFTPDTRKDKRDLLADYRAADYAVLRTRADLASAPLDQRWVGVFTSSHLPYEVDRLGGITNVSDTPTLADMTVAALRNFGREKRFILQVEGGRVDHASHSMDAAGAMREMISFDQAVEVCLSYQKENPDTLLLLTSDHGNGNPGLNGAGSGYRDSSRLLGNIPKVKQSIGEIAKRLKAAKTPDEMVKELFEVTGYKATPARMEMLRPFIDGKGVALYDANKSDTAGLSEVLANYTGISFTSGAHTSDFVPVLAFGPGAEAFQGFIGGPDIFHRYTEFAGVRHRNPQEPLRLNANALSHDWAADVV